MALPLGHATHGHDGPRARPFLCRNFSARDRAGPAGLGHLATYIALPQHHRYRARASHSLSHSQCRRRSPGLPTATLRPSRSPCSWAASFAGSELHRQQASAVNRSSGREVASKALCSCAPAASTFARRSGGAASTFAPRSGGASDMARCGHCYILFWLAVSHPLIHACFLQYFSLQYHHKSRLGALSSLHVPYLSFNLSSAIGSSAYNSCALATSRRPGPRACRPGARGWEERKDNRDKRG